MEIFNIYCDESCHLENDGQRAMVLGAISCKKEDVKKINLRIREIIADHGMSRSFEPKWTKVSPSGLGMYLSLVDYFFDNSDLNARILVIPDKTKINHSNFDQDHDEWYYKMYFTMLKPMISPSEGTEIYIDIKDTIGNKKIRKLHDVLANSYYDFNKDIIKNIQPIRSHEVAIMSLVDILIGAAAYKARGLETSPAKIKIVERIKERSGYSLSKSTLPSEKKFNYFIWRPR